MKTINTKQIDKLIDKLYLLKGKQKKIEDKELIFETIEEIAFLGNKINEIKNNL